MLKSEVKWWVAPESRYQAGYPIVLGVAISAVGGAEFGKGESVVEATVLKFLG